MNDDPLPANSLAEAHLYLMATACSRCGRGPLRGGDARAARDAEPVLLTVAARCAACGHEVERTFSVPGSVRELRAKEREGALVRVNPSSEPSKILDVAQWTMLFRMITEAAARQADKVEARRLGYEAAQCLEEALKFYAEDNDLPPPEGFFHEGSRRLRQECPEEFSRERLIGLRAKLPTLDAMEACQVGRRARRKRWWMLWR